jgi:hypothetical protein
MFGSKLYKYEYGRNYYCIENYFKTQLQILKEHYPHEIFYTDEHGEDKRIFF